MRFRGLLFASALLSSAVGCVKTSGGGDRQPDKATQAGRAASGDVAESIAAMGDGAPVVLLLRDGGWKPAPEKALPRLGFEGLFESHSRAQALAKLGQGLKVPVEESDFAYLRAGEPVVIATGEVPGARISVTAEHRLEGERFGPARTLVWLPTRELEKTRAAIRGRLADAHALQNVTSEKGWEAWTISRPRDPDATIVAMGPWRGGVGIVLLTGGRDLDDARDAKAIARWLELPQPVSLAATTAARLPLETTHPISGVFRPSRVTAFAHWAGHRDGRRAIDDTPPDQRASARFRAMTIASTPVAYLRTEDAQVGSWGFSLRVSDTGVEIVAAGDLLAKGRVLLEGARLDETKSWTYLARKPVHMDSNLDFAALAPKAPAPLHSDLPAEQADRSRRMCGPACGINDWTRYPLRMPAKRLAAAGMLDAENERSPLSFDMTAGQDAVIIELAYGFGERPPKRPTAPALAGAAATEGEPLPAADVACVRGVAGQVMRADVLYGGGADTVNAKLPLAVKAAFEAASCEGASERARNDAQMLARWFADAATDWSISYGEMARARAVAAAACEAGEFCEGKERLEAVPVVEPLTMPSKRSCGAGNDYAEYMVGGGTPLTITKTAAYVGDVAVKRQGRAIAEHLAEYRLPPSDMEPRTDVEGIGIVVEPGLTIGEIRPALEGLAGAGAFTLRPAYMRDNASIYGGPSMDAFAFLFELDVDFSVEPKARHASWELEEEPPPDIEEPPPSSDDGDGEAGKMGKPASKSKSGLYGMVGVGRSDGPEGELEDESLTVALDGSRVVVSGDTRRDTGKPLKMTGRVDALDALFESLEGIELGEAGPGSGYGYGRYGERWEERGLRITVTDDTPWESLVKLTLALCGRELVVDLDVR